ncbi:hypothetical protein DFH11DRAFT_1733268 [Phellopilus nigrolimitatus]|nr:hypothetical protein DFH11DRAFT_1733268 [Phellopilus nigrolimitatus]
MCRIQIQLRVSGIEDVTAFAEPRARLAYATRHSDRFTSDSTPRAERTTPQSNGEFLRLIELAYFSTASLPFGGRPALSLRVDRSCDLSSIRTNLELVERLGSVLNLWSDFEPTELRLLSARARRPSSFPADLQLVIPFPSPIGALPTFPGPSLVEPTAKRLPIVSVLRSQGSVLEEGIHSHTDFGFVPIRVHPPGSRTIPFALLGAPSPSSPVFGPPERTLFGPASNPNNRTSSPELHLHEFG